MSVQFFVVHPPISQKIVFDRLRVSKEIGSYLLLIWDLPSQFLETGAYYEKPH